MKVNLDLKKMVALLLAIITVSLISTILMGKSIHTQSFDTTVADTENTENIMVGQMVLDELNVWFDLPLQGGPRKDWHDRAVMQADSLKTGLGEQGLRIAIEDTKEYQEMIAMSIKKGFNSLLSDKISVNRTIADTRPLRCKSRKYLVKLPNVSVIMVFHNTHLSVLLRAIHSIINRTPHELLHEVILVDDGSTAQELQEQLDKYVNEHFGSKVSIIRQKKRTGMPAARVAGVNSANGTVMVFCDASIEVIYNWLPPLLEPMTLHYKIVTSPILDEIDNTDFSFKWSDPLLWRGGFDWHFNFNKLPVLQEDIKGESQPYRNPVMEGTVFAIDRKYFLELGGYDEGLDASGGEQYEMSFKIWMCGGMLLQVPCSRVGHIAIDPKDAQDPTWQKGELLESTKGEYDTLTRNYKRVAEVWMDGYKHYLYLRDPYKYHINAGNVTRQKEIRESLQCNSFDWYLHQVAPDFLKRFPLVEPRGYGSGAIQNVAYPGLCIDALAEGFRKPVGLAQCSANLTHPPPTQFWRLTNDLEIVSGIDLNCLQMRGTTLNATVWLNRCTKGDNQIWSYSINRKWIQQSSSLNRCLEAFVDGKKAVVRVNHCYPESPSQRWVIGWTNKYLSAKFRLNSTSEMKRRFGYPA
ncbi:N-acetylgalactosaminyltransferase 4-like [Drosophila pseudoobscura]|uniref:Polypeptide N-acetylgalactosaminyltransferase n=1 Tax=Drosophila pseudoobscura pseudoobscura TaxID=46245 RepID=A0A6I8UXL7_DROPS|nr:N-acetylgalactosaminyltransferase 4 [Drosophila pseudoobscura]